MLPWNHWFHCMGHTYGTWLPGDPKGFRTRDHREHVDGDYRNPPPKGKYDGLHDHAKRAMKRDPVFLDRVQRQRALEELVASLQRRHFEIEVFSVDRIHIHGLVRVPDHDPKRWTGVAKKESSHHCKQTGHAPTGGMWATGTKCLPIASERHFDRVKDYIRGHAEKGAVVWVRRAAPGMEQFHPDSLLVE
jgi:REP element-mobilizing transposase RayT